MGGSDCQHGGLCECVCECVCVCVMASERFVQLTISHVVPAEKDRTNLPGFV